MKQSVLSAAILFASLLTSPLVLGANEQAEFSIHLFQNGLPIADAELAIISKDNPAAESEEAQATTNETLIYSWRADSESIITTNSNGSIAGKLPAGEYHLTIKTESQIFAFELPLQAAENVQILVTFYADGKKPLLNIESSVVGTIAGTDDLMTEEQSQGDGTIVVQISSVDTEKPVEAVQIFLSGLTQRLRTDQNGRVSVTIPVGSYSVSLLHAAYSSQTRDAVVIEKDQTTKLDFKLTPAGVELAEYVVLEPFIAGTLASIIEEQKTSSAVTTIIGAEQFSRSGDSDVASALQRASGLTLVGGQFIFIRGLGERFSSTLVNGAAVPSPDPTRRVVPLDLFPTNILESIMVQKSYSPDRPGEFAGGTLEMRTKGIPDEFFFDFSMQTGFNDNATFANALAYKGGDTDFLGFDDGARELPDSIAAVTANGGTIQPETLFNPEGVSPEELESFGEDLSGVWDVSQKKRGPDAGFQTSMGDSFDLGNFRVGYLAAGGWKRQSRNQNEINREFSSSGNSNDDSLRLTRDFDVKRSLQEVQLNGYFAGEAEYKDKHKISYKSMFLRQTIDETRVGQGFTDAEVTDVRRTKLKYFSNQLLMQQVGGSHQLDWAKDLSIDWLYTNSTAKREEPKTRDFRFDANNQGEFALSRRSDSNQTLFANLIDKDQSWRVDAKLPFEFSNNYKMALNGGFIAQQKTRESSIKRFSFFPVGPNGRNQDILAQSSLEDILQPSNIGPDGFQLRETTRPTDSYNASQDLFSYYGKLDMSFYERFSVTGGLRWEDNHQLVETFQSVANNSESIVSKLDRLDTLPSATATWSISDKQQLRAGFSQTISRPDFRELSPAPFTDISTNQETTGNPDLQQTEITNFDVRWEYYLSANENLLTSFFWKDLMNPIELVALPGSAGLQTFQNADKATIFGFEFELLKSLSFINSHLENFFAGGNYTWSKSNVELNAKNLEAQTSASRQLQGHSAQILNFQLGYDNPIWGTQATLLYNIASERIVAAGVLGAPDKFEQPFSQLDFVLNQNINKWASLRISMQNLLDDDVTVMQGKEITRQFRRGRQFNMGVRISF